MKKYSSQKKRVNRPGVMSVPTVNKNSEMTSSVVVSKGDGNISIHASNVEIVHSESELKSQ
jgi:hypothetical protein